MHCTLYQVCLILHAFVVFTFSDAQTAVCKVDALVHEEDRRTATTLTYSWAVTDGGQDGHSDCLSVQLCINDLQETCQDHTGNITGTSVFTGLTPGYWYQTSLLVRNTDDPANYSDIRTQNGKTLPVAASDVIAVPGMPPQGVLTVSWLEPAGGYSGVRVVCEGPGPGQNNLTLGANITTAECTGLNPVTEYNITVTTLQTDETPVSAPVVTASTEALLSPTNVSVSHGASPTTSLFVTWLPPPNYFYAIEVRCAQHILSVPNTENSTTIHNLTSGVRYYVSLHTYMEDRRNVTSLPTEYVGNTTVPNEPILSLIYHVTDHITIDVAADGDCSEFNVHYRSLNANTSLEGSTTVRCPPGQKSTWFELENLESNSEYRFDVSTISYPGPDGDLNWTEGDNATIQVWTSPDPMSRPFVLGKGTDWIEVGWPEADPHPDHIARYYLYVSSEVLPERLSYQEYGPVDVEPISDCVSSNLTVTNPSTLTSLEPNTEYSITVLAVNPGDCGQTGGLTVRTLSGESNAWIAAAVLVPVAVFVIFLVLGIMYKRKKRKDDLHRLSDHLETPNRYDTLTEIYMWPEESTEANQSVY